MPPKFISHFQKNNGEIKYKTITLLSFPLFTHLSIKSFFIHNNSIKLLHYQGTSTHRTLVGTHK